MHHTTISAGNNTRTRPHEMFSRRSMMALLAVLALSAQAAESAIAAPNVCSAADVGKGFCINCKTKAKCETDGALPVPKGNCTVAGEACTVLANVATCKPFANTACTCAKPAQCDAYDPNSVLVCLSGGITVSTNCNATGNTCVNGACVTPASTTSTASPSQLCTGKLDDGFVVSKPLCTTAAYCSGGISQGTTDCPSGKYFDMDDKSCMSLPPVPCAGCGTGACPDKSDCSKWYICEGGTVLDEETCDAATPDFDILSNECVASGSGTCTGNANCTYALTTSAPTTTTPVSSSTTTLVSSFTTTTVSSSTTTPVTGSTTTPVSSSTTTPVSSSTTTTSRPATCTAANVGQRYPYAGNCKKYWSCRQVATGVYAYVESTCLGELVFNAATGYCDTLANVPSCVVGK